MSGKCTCEPCTYPHGYDGGAGCCLGNGIESYDYDCPVSDHAEMATYQHGPREQRDGNNE